MPQWDRWASDPDKIFDPKKFAIWTPGALFDTDFILIHASSVHTSQIEIKALRNDVNPDATE